MVWLRSLIRIRLLIKFILFELRQAILYRSRTFQGRSIVGRFVQCPTFSKSPTAELRLPIVIFSQSITQLYHNNTIDIPQHHFQSIMVQRIFPSSSPFIFNSPSVVPSHFPCARVKPDALNPYDAILSNLILLSCP